MNATSRANLQTVALPEQTTLAARFPSTRSSAASVAQSEGLAGRRFSKAKPIAARLGICTRTLFRWADAGMIARHEINARVVLFDEAEVAALIDSARIG
ncbi:MAG: hypothetical protein IPL39_02085 [Opitutaceae bacterium]|nr:hypothetical protein [Opitutaceae bacterium]